MDIRQIQSFLIQNDYSPTMKGFYALADALKIALDTPEDIVSTTWLYREVAQLHHTSWQSVEHNIRLTVQNQQLDTGTVGRPLPNKDVIAQILARLRRMEAEHSGSSRN